MASRLGDIKLIPPPKRLTKSKTVAETIKGLPVLQAGTFSKKDPMHKCSSLSDLNMQRIKISKPGGSWRDWPRKLVADCHKKPSGNSYPAVYGRMEWGKPSPTITTQFYGFGNGRFGHPSQNRALSLREGALLQGFPKAYQFVRPGDPVETVTVGRLIGNAVPVTLGRVIGKSINQHVRSL